MISQQVKPGPGPLQYLAGIGFIALAVAALVRVADRALPQGRFQRSIAAGGLVAALALLSWSQAHIYRDNETLYRDTIAKNPESFLAHYNLGYLLIRRGHIDEAIERFDRAIALALQDGLPSRNLADARDALAQLPSKPDRPEVLAPRHREARHSPPPATQDLE